jgi:hypothetical protein
MILISLREKYKYPKMCTHLSYSPNLAISRCILNGYCAMSLMFPKAT